MTAETNADMSLLLWSLIIMISLMKSEPVETFINNGSVSANQSDYKTIVRKLSDVLSNKFRETVANELGTAHYNLQPHLKASHSYVTDVDLLHSITEKVSYKLSSAYRILKNMESIVNNTETPSFTHPCPFNSIPKDTFTGFDFLPNISLTDEIKTTKVMGHFKDVKIKRQYFLSHLDYATDKDCASTPHSNLRYLYHKIVHPDPKLIVFVLNNSISVEYGVNIIKETINILQSADVFAIKLTNSTDFLNFEDMCQVDGVAEVGNATESNKLLLREYLLTITTSKWSVSATHIDKEVKSLLERPNLPQNKLVILLTDTKLLKTHSWQNIFPVLKENQTVYYAVGAVAEQLHKNNSLSILHFDNTHNHTVNRTISKLHIYENGVFGQVASAFISLIPGKYEMEDIIIEKPLWEATERDFLVPLILPTDQGIFGLDIYWSDLAEDITYFTGSNVNRRAFIMDFSGTVVMHSFFPRPELALEKIKFTNFEYVENYDFVDNVRRELLSQPEGSLSVPIKDSNDSYVYSWKWAKKLYIVCIVSLHNQEQKFNEHSYTYLARASREILFHRLDLFPPKGGKICRHFKQIATIDQGTVYLSPSSFQSPFNYLYDMIDSGEALTYMQNYLAYLKGVAQGILSNPGLKNEIQRDVDFLSSILQYYKRQHLHGPYSKYVIRRYAVTESGVLVMFPGTVLEYDYEPVRRPWYTSAIENIGKIILSPPNLDMGGAGYVVSISYAIKQTYYPTMVVSMDVTMGFLYKILIDSLPLCALSYVKCFIMNNRGYLISHPGLMDPNGSGPIEQQHITHKESVIAMDMLNHKGFVTKRLCNHFSDRTIQRFYEFNTSLPNVLSNVVTVDPCVHYYIAAIPGTNTFIGVVNASCNLGAFCPCSMVDRLCLNCNRMEQTDCECPCECSTETQNCPYSNSSKNSRNIPLCGVVSENNNHKSHYFYNFAENLKPCFDFQCESHVTHSSCLGVMGCEWCQLDTDGVTSLSSPFCTSQSSCFNGVLGAVTPYGEGTFGHVTRDDVLGSYSAIGPIAGCIVTVSLVIAVSIYCYRQNMSSASCHNLYVDGPAETWPEQDVQLSHLPSDDAHGDPSGQDKLLQIAESDAPISPYRVITGYRRPHTTGDSDHGYSTMTPHEDSEATAFSINDPILLSDDTKSDVSCPISSKIKPKIKSIDMTVTVLPCGKNSIIAPVTVHRHMEAS